MGSCDGSVGVIGVVGWLARRSRVGFWLVEGQLPGAENGVRNVRVFGALLGMERTVIEGVEFDEPGELLVVRVRPARAARGRCGVCRRRCQGYDAGDGARRWRALDAGTVRVFVQAQAPRVRCAEHGVVVAHVPWARHGAGHTRQFDQQVAWLATQCSKTGCSPDSRHPPSLLPLRQEGARRGALSGTNHLAVKREAAVKLRRRYRPLRGCARS